MKKTFILLASVIVAVVAFSSCTKEKTIKFSPSSVSMYVGDTKTVSVEIVGMDTGTYDIQYTYPSNLVNVETSFGKFTLTGLNEGTGTINAYLIDYPEVKGSLSITVKD